MSKPELETEFNKLKEQYEAVVAKDGFAEFAKNIALQIGAYPTPYLTRNDVPASVIESEKAIIKVQLANDPKMANKPEKVLDGIVMGKLGKFYEANCLVDMAYVKEDDMTVAQYVAKTAKELGGKIEIASQNHDHAVCEKSLEGTGLKVTHINLLDNTVEGIENADQMIFSVQFQPGSVSGSRGVSYLYEQFVENMKEFKTKRGATNA